MSDANIHSGLKHCPGCETAKERSEFSKNKRRHDGLTNYCKECWRAISRQQYLKNRDKIAANYRENAEVLRVVKRGKHPWEHVPCDQCGLNFRRQVSAEAKQCLPCRHGKPIPHGKSSSYVRGCRCRPCTDAMTGASSKRSSKRNPDNFDKECCEQCGLSFTRTKASVRTTCSPCQKGKPIPHGRTSTYARGCRCRPCTTAASSAAVRKRRERFAAAGMADDTGYRARCRKYGGRYEFVSRPAVYERDGWICHICSDPVSPDVQWPDPMSVSLDHVIPLASGGDHSFENVRCSHLRCNMTRPKPRPKVD